MKLELIEKMDNVYMKYNRALRGIEIKEEIDEIAILFENRELLGQFVANAGEDWNHFGSARDLVYTRPMDTSYRVMYEFFNVGGRPYRVEAMALIDGHSPVHASATALFPYMPSPELKMESPLIIHASWKSKSRSLYGETLWLLGVNHFELAQQCKSDYGEFCYYNHPHLGFSPPIYFKPRLNMRDEIYG